MGLISTAGGEGGRRWFDGRMVEEEVAHGEPNNSPPAMPGGTRSGVSHIPRFIAADCDEKVLKVSLISLVN